MNTLYLNSVKQFVGGCIAQFGIVFENDQFPYGHFAAGSGMVVFKHVQDGLPEEGQVFFAEPGHFPGQVG